MVWTDEGGSGPDLLHYCRIRRGASSCDNPSATMTVYPDQPTTPDAPGNSPAYNDDSWGPRVVAVGDELALLTRRYPNVIQTPLGTSDTNTYLWLSDDGGQSLIGPGLVGDAEVSGGATVFGSADSPRIGLISDTKSGGTYFQAITPGTYTAAEANLGAGGPDRAYSGSLSTVDGRPVAAFEDLSNNEFIRQWNGTGSPNDEATWSQTETSGTEPRLAAGPAGSFLADRAGFHEPLRVRPLDGTTPGVPVSVSPTGDVGSHDVFADPGGGLHVAWVDTSTGASDRLLERNSTDGKSFTSPRILADSDQLIDQVHIASAGDGGGFAAYVAGGGSQGLGKVEVAPFGNQQATGEPGLGGRPGSGAALGTTVKCQEIGYGAVQILASQGCLVGAGGKEATKVSEGPVKINGLEIIPDAGARILLGTRERTIDSTGKVTVQIRAAGGPIVLFHGEIHLKLPSGADGVHLATFDTSKFPVDIKGFPVTGDIDVILHQDSVEIPISLKLPDVFGGLTGNMTLRASNERGLEFSSMRFRVGNLLLGPVLLKDLDISWDGNSSWSGSGTIVIAGAVISADLEFLDGAFNKGSVEITPVPFPGVPLFTDVFLNKISGGLELDPFAIEAGGSVGARPVAPPDLYVFGIDSKLRVSTKPTFAIDVTGEGKLVGFPISESDFHGDAAGYFSVHSKSRIDLADIVSAGTEINGFLDADHGQFGASAGFSGCVGDPPFGVCSGFEGLVSSTGIAGCALGFVGFGYHWGGDAELLGPPTCDTGPYEVKARTSEAGPGAGGDQSFKLPGGLPGASIRLTGSGGPPSVVVISPSGERLTPVPVSDPGAAAAPVTVAVSGDEAHVGLRRPARGTWAVEAQPGPSITELAVAHSLSKPKVSARVKAAKSRGKRHSRKRTLVYKATSRKGLVVHYFERIRGGGHLIGTAHSKRGRITFNPGDGPAGKRTIIAQVEQDGLPRLSKEVAHYRAPGPIRPAKVRRVRLRRKGHGVKASWRKSAGSTTYAVTIRVSDGRKLLKLVESPRVTVGGISRSDRVRLTVSGRSEAGRTGKSTSAALKTKGHQRRKRHKKKR